MREVVLDANVIVAWLDDADALAPRARELLQRLKEEGAELVLVDIAVTEAISVLCRRAKQRRTSPPDLAAAIAKVRSWAERGVIRWLAREHERVMPDVLAIVESTAGALNFNDGLLAVLQREAVIGEVASFDGGLDAFAGFARLA